MVSIPSVLTLLKEGHGKLARKKINYTNRYFNLLCEHIKREHYKNKSQNKKDTVMLKKTLPTTIQLFKAEATFITQPKYPELSHSQALHTLSKEYGYASWHNVKPLLGDYPCKENWERDEASLSRRRDYRVLSKTIQTKIGVAGYLYYYPATKEVESVVKIYSTEKVGRKTHKQTKEILSKTNEEIRLFWDKEYNILVAEEIQKYLIWSKAEDEAFNKAFNNDTEICLGGDASPQAQKGETLLFSVVSMDEEDDTDINKTERLYLLDDGRYRLKGVFGTIETEDGSNTDFADLLFYLSHCIDGTTRLNVKKVFFLDENFPELLKIEEARSLFSYETDIFPYTREIFNVIHIYIQYKDKIFMENATDTEGSELLFDGKEIIDNEYCTIREVKALLYHELSHPRKKIVSTFLTDAYRGFLYEMAYTTIDSKLSLKNIDQFIEEVVEKEMPKEIEAPPSLLKAKEKKMNKITKKLGYDNPEFLMEKIEYYMEGELKKDLIRYMERREQ